MKSLIFAVLLGATGASVAQTSVHLEIGQPGFYGAIDIGDTRPRLVYERPIIIERHEHYAPRPVYLRVPPGHRKNWRKHCHRYDACGRQVLFVRDDWYQNTYAPRYREQHGYAQPRVVERRVVERVVERHYVSDHGGGGKHKDKHDKHDKHGGGHGHGHGHGKD